MPTYERNNIPDNLEFIKYHFKLDNEDLGDIVGRSGATISDYVRRKTTPPLDSLIAICNHFNIELEAITFGDLRENYEKSGNINILKEDAAKYNTVETRITDIEEKLAKIKALL